MSHIYNQLKETKEEYIKNRRYLHQIPEVGFELPKTIAYVWERLEAYGCQPVKVGQAGISVVLGKPGKKTFLIRGDMDALPMQEESRESFASCNGAMHACGHDIHTTALLGAAKYLKEHEEQLKGQVKIMFQPCEEKMMGAQDMVQAGILENPAVDAALALHVNHDTLGKVIYSSGYACGSSDIFKIKIKGKGGHGAAPHLNVDPINIAAHLILALQAVNSREVHPDQMLVLNICMVHSGQACNITPEEAELQGTIRTMNHEVRSFAKKRLCEISRLVADTFRAECTVTYEGQGIPPMYNTPELLKDIVRYVSEIDPACTIQEGERMTGSEDFSVISELVPSALLWVGSGSTEEGYPYGVHDARVTFSEDVIPLMTAIYVESTLKWLSKQC